MTATGAEDRREADGPLEQDAAPGPATRAAGARRVGRELVRGIGRSYPDSDLALWAAGATFFGIIGVVPIVLVSVGPERTQTIERAWRPMRSRPGIVA